MEVSVAVHHWLLVDQDQKRKHLTSESLVRVDQPTGGRAPAPASKKGQKVVIGDEEFELDEHKRIHLGPYAVVIPGGESKSDSKEAIYSDIYGYVKLVPGTVYACWFKSTAVAFPHPTTPSLAKKLLKFFEIKVFQMV